MALHAFKFCHRFVNPSLLQTILAACICTISSLSCATQAANPEKPHHTENGYRNIYLKEDHGFFQFLQWRWERLWKGIPPPAAYKFAVAPTDSSFLRANKEKTTLTWIGHATFLFQIRGMNILTDPHFSERASPVQWAGPKRVVPPSPALEKLPPVNMVLISHDHYDSLDVASVKRLYTRKGGKNTIFFAPLGLKNWLASLGVANVIEMDWWDEFNTGPLTIAAVPMQHWGKRSPFSRNNHLWASWIVLSKDFRFYFGGDAGYSLHFQETGEQYGPFDLAALPIGAYEPRWFMKNHHLNPEEAVQAHIDLNSKKSVAMHWGTFILTDEPLDEPPVRLRQAMKDRGLRDDEFLVLKHGETIVLE
jgi:L-ascorbate metabolism protein UlaG (beta-lactamase superfamily)